MAKIKSYTDIEQSKKLAEILPLESSDMCWTNHYYGSLRSSITISVKSIDEYKNLLKNFADLTEIDVFYPAWSLSALLDVLPDAITSNGGISFELNIKKNIIEYSNHSLYLVYKSVKSDNLIDACVDMIIKLHKRKML